MEDVSEVTRSLGEVVLEATEHEDPVKASAVLETFTNALAKSRDPIVREAFIESCLDVLKPRGDEQDAGRLSVLEDAALTVIPAFLPLVKTSTHAKEVLDLIAAHSEPREVVLALNQQLVHFTELADPFAVSDDEEDTDIEDNELDWEYALPQVETVLDMYATALPRLRTQRSTPTLLALQDSLTPLIQAVPATAPAELAVPISRSLLSRTAKIVTAGWNWSKTTTDAGGEQKAMLTEVLQTAIMIFGPCSGADLTSRWFLATHPQFSGLHPEIDGPEQWEEGQAVLDQSLATATSLGLDHWELVERIINTSSVKPHSSISSLILLASTLPALAAKKEEFAPSKTIIADAMPLLTLAIGGSALDAGTVVTWALIHAAQAGSVVLEYDQATFFIELVMPLIQVNSSPTTRLAMSKLLGAILLEPSNPFEGVRVLAISLLREQIASKAGPSPLLNPTLLEQLGPILFSVPVGPLDWPLNDVMASMWPVWLTECSNLVWFLLQRDTVNATGFADRERLDALRSDFLGPVQKAANKWQTDAGDNPSFELVLDRLQDAVARALKASEAPAA
ncbi:uncharacterized protein LOC62_01G001167 [Vanrija pseudolonga]|uniref:Uncharacterized protein n=1 Tax=Vanrija pseudolonga TaxID=143232 RepID=A0AAF1BIU5_9TREE|nr:hypothetical protein LOC62_01G001167 [Vanrija pseudolonga]